MVADTEKGKQLQKAFRGLAEEIIGRSTLAGYLGKSYYSEDGTGAKRDLYKALGYIKSPTFDHYYTAYERQDIAAAVVDAPALASWKLDPIIVEVGSTKPIDTKFESEIVALFRQHRVFHYFCRADCISGIGKFGVVFVGMNDGKEISEPLERATKLLYLRPYMEDSVVVDTWDEDVKSPRYGLPLTYKITTESRTSTKDEKRKQDTRREKAVHCSRVIHIAEGLQSNDVYGTPRLQKVLNRLEDLNRVAGGSAEMFWRGAMSGLAFTNKDGHTFRPDELDDFEDEIQAYLHDLQRYLRLEGVDVKEIQTQVVDPSQHADLLLTLISAASRIPKRILLGSERGELASSQDERAWLDRVTTRRTDFVEPTIVRPFVDMMARSGVVTTPTKGYDIIWPPLLILGEKDDAEIKKIQVETLAKYVSTPAAGQVIPPNMFLRKYMKFTDDEIAEANEEMGNMVDDTTAPDVDEE